MGQYKVTSDNTTHRWTVKFTGTLVKATRDELKKVSADVGLIGDPTAAGKQPEMRIN